MVITRSDIAKNKLTDSKAIGLKPAKRKIKPLSCIVAKYKKHTRGTRSGPLKKRPVNLCLGSDLYCSSCGLGGRVLETCSSPGCCNTICVKYSESDPNKRGICLYDASKWSCYNHGGEQKPLRVDINKTVHIQALELASFAKHDAILSFARGVFSPYKLGTVSFLQHTFHDATTLIKAGNVINESWNPKAEKWLFVTTHSNEEGDLWYEEGNNGEGFAEPILEVFSALLHGREDINLVLLTCGSVVEPVGPKTQNILCTKLTEIAQAFSTSGLKNLLLFTAQNLEPRNVIYNVMQVIEANALSSKGLVIALHDHFRNNSGDLSPVMLLQRGVGSTYVHPRLAPCRKHPRAMKHGKKCYSITAKTDSSYKVEVKNCNAKRMSPVAEETYITNTVALYELNAFLNIL